MIAEHRIPAISGVISSYRRQCETLGVTFCMGTEVTEDLIFAKKPDAVVIATGSTPLMPPIKGIDNPHVVTAEMDDDSIKLKGISAGTATVTVKVNGAERSFKVKVDKFDPDLWD